MTKSIPTHQAFVKFYFKGGDPFWWLVKLYEFFVLDNTPPHENIWFQDTEASGLCTNWMHFICTLQDRFQASILDASMKTTTQESKMQEPTNCMLEDQEPILDTTMEAPTQESTIQESAIQVSVI